MKPRLSLKGRGLQILSQREHSRSEMRRKLLAHARAGEPDEAAASPEEQVDAVLDWLQAQRYLSEDRFVESRVHARASRFGNLRIRQELAQHGVTLSAQTDQQLKETELGRAREVWSRRFGEVAPEANERARQARFLIARGFSSEVVRRVVRGVHDD